MKCPACGQEAVAKNACPRCRTDLSLLFYIESLPDRLAEEGNALLDEGRPLEGIEKLQVASALGPADRGLCSRLATELARAGLDEWALLQFQRLEEFGDLAPAERRIARLARRRRFVRAFVGRVLGVFGLFKIPDGGRVAP
ncbi:MAG: hypothetical protein HY720_09105 [Planctomycetes bacterium]|nr:hypothetical protein [Planctomycetota bacterium]